MVGWQPSLIQGEERNGGRRRNESPVDRRKLVEKSTLPNGGMECSTAVPNDTIRRSRSSLWHLRSKLLIVHVIAQWTPWDDG